MEQKNNLIVIGAAGTIGNAAVELMADRFRKVFLLDLNEAALDKLVKNIPNAEAVVASALDPRAVADIFTAAAFGGLDAAILAVGTEGPVTALEDCSDEEFDNVMNLNVKTVWLGLKNALKIMKPQCQGSIVALSSISGVIGMPQLSPYAASKHAVMGLVRTAAREAASSNVRVNAVCPAPVESDMMRRIDGALSEKFPARLHGQPDASKSVPMQRYARPSEVAEAIAYLCSDASSYITGSAFMVDGGISCR
jgi:NAD(P)-dependent dehydrogenase (short-subunit alcohol dehydrogenase family)